MNEREEVRKAIANQFRIARQEGSLRKYEDGYCDADATLALEHSDGSLMLGVIASEQNEPQVKQGLFGKTVEFTAGFASGVKSIKRAGWVKLADKGG